MKIKHAVSVASFLGGLLYSGLSFAQEQPGISQPDDSGDAERVEEPNFTDAVPAPATGVPAAPAKNLESCPPAKPKVYGTNPSCQRVKGPDFYCMPANVAEAMGLTPLSWDSYASTKAGACPGKSMCAGPVKNVSDLEAKIREISTDIDGYKSALQEAQDRIAALEASKAELNDFDSFVLGLKENCRGAYDKLNDKLNTVKSDYSTALELGKKIKDIFSEEGGVIALTPGQALQSADLPETPAAVGDLIKQYDAAGERYQKSKAQLAEEVERLKKEGCGQTVIIKDGGQFVVAPFAQYAFSADAENQGRLGVFAGYQTGRWTFGARAAAILQYEDTDSDTDKSNVQTTALPGGVEKTTSDITDTTIEEKDYAAVGPAVSYSIGRVELGAGVDALVGQRRTTKDYTGYLELAKDGQTLDGKKQVTDSTPETETRFGAYPHVNFDVKLWRGLHAGAEGGYNPRSKSTQGALGLKYIF